MENFTTLFNTATDIVNRTFGNEQQKEMLREQLLLLVALGIKMSDSDETFKAQLDNFVQLAAKNHKSK